MRNNFNRDPELVFKYLRVKNFFIPALATCLIVTAILASCNKINLPTELGLDMIPPIDNIHTFDTTLEVETYNKLFTFAEDSFYSAGSDEQFLGVISNDPIFGTTDAQMYFQLLPSGALKSTPGKRYIDSVVLVLDYVEPYGDTAKAQNIEVAEIAPGTPFNPLSYDSTAGLLNRSSGYPVSVTFPTTTVLGTATVIPYKLKDSIDVIRPNDTTRVAKQLRIKLNDALGSRLLDMDSATIANDTLFKAAFNGLAVRSLSSDGNTILGFTLGGSTALSVYYRYDNATTAGDLDTTSANFVFSLAKSASANHITRDYAGTQVAATANDDIADPLVYIQNTPGTYANIKIPGLKGLKNSVIHLAQLQMEQVYDNQDTVFYAAPLFMDMYDSAAAKYKTIPLSIENSYLSAYDLSGSLLQISNSGYLAFGGLRVFYKRDPSANLVKEWQFNMTRYVQYLVKGTFTTGHFRLYTTPYMKIENGNPNSASTQVLVQTAIASSSSSVTSAPAKGRVRLGGGDHPTQKMKLRVVYSKL